MKKKIVKKAVEKGMEKPPKLVGNRPREFIKEAYLRILEKYKNVFKKLAGIKPYKQLDKQ